MGVGGATALAALGRKVVAVAVVPTRNVAAVERRTSRREDSTFFAMLFFVEEGDVDQH